MVGAGIFIAAVAAGLWVLAGVQFFQKGIPLNNAYLYASQKEREQMDFAPYFRQSAIVFLLLGMAFALMALECFWQVGWLYGFVGAFLMAALLYAVVSTMRIQRKR